MGGQDVDLACMLPTHPYRVADARAHADSGVSKSSYQKTLIDFALPDPACIYHFAPYGLRLFAHPVAFGGCARAVAFAVFGSHVARTVPVVMPEIPLLPGLDG
jgi:hypothetical protein